MDRMGRGDLWRESALGLLVASAGMVVLFAAGLEEVMWAPPFFVAALGARRRRCRDAPRPAAHAQ